MLYIGLTGVAILVVAGLLGALIACGRQKSTRGYEAGHPHLPMQDAYQVALERRSTGRKPSISYVPAQSRQINDDSEYTSGETSSFDPSSFTSSYFVSQTDPPVVAGGSRRPSIYVVESRR